ncbi:MAG: GntR family transcriptional regulator [Syntrophales bacterium]|nr:GntR family transcriptional regulator [Syntrophales bacterium]
MSDNRKAPIYVQLAETLKGRILQEEYRAGELLAPARDLEQEFGVSAITIRKAMSILVQEGYVEPKQGVGTRVTKRPEEIVELKLSGNFWNWADSALTRNLQTETEVLELATVPCPRRIAELLHTKGSAPIWRMKRIRKLNGHPASFIVNYALPELMSGVNKEMFLKQPFLTVFRDHCGVQLASVEQMVRATVADIDTSAKLGIGFGEALFLVENTYMDMSQAPVEVSCIHFRGDLYVYKTKISF